jgi:hypothetical protein
MKNLALSTLALVAASSSAFGAFTLTSGNATFSASGTPNFGDSTVTTADFRPEGGSTTDHIFYYNWSYRAPGAGNRGFSFLDTPVVSVTGDTATFTYTNAGPNPVGFNRFNAVLTLKLTDLATTGHAQLDATLVFTAATTNTGATTWAVFNGQDFDVSGTTASDAILVNDVNAVEYTQTDTVTGFFAKAQGFGASRYQVGTSSGIRGLLTGGSLANLNNTNTVATGDNAGAFQWDFSLQPGESKTIASSFIVAPAPGAAGMLGLAGVAALRRRRA